jgi:hypothetical protein
MTEFKNFSTHNIVSTIVTTQVLPLFSFPLAGGRLGWG